MEITFAIDIDGTIADHNMEYFAHLCNTRLELGIERERLADITYKAFMQMPEIIAYCQARGEQHFLEKIEGIENEMQQMAEALISLPTLPQASEGVQRLSEIGAIYYYTVRVDSPDVRDATRTWLQNNDFPRTDSVVFCKSIDSKLIGMYKFAQSHCRIVLIDDLWSKLLDVYRQLRMGQHPRFSPAQCTSIADALRQHLILVAFRASSLPAERPRDLQVIALPSWKDSHRFIDSLSRKEFPLCR